MLARLPSPSAPFIENYAIMLKPESEESVGKMVGVIGIPRLSHDESAAEVGYGICVEEWGRGYATEAFILFRQHYFNSQR
jgi:RimJ/RimL family protein N-acetyltransferase